MPMDFDMRGCDRTALCNPGLPFNVSTYVIHVIILFTNPKGMEGQVGLVC